MSDGAHQGVSAKRALDTILGGEPAPTEEEQMPIGDFFVWLLADDQEPHDYEECARREARTILRYFLEDPVRATLPAETEYDWDGDPEHGANGMKPEYVKALGLYEVMEAEGIVHEEGITGFQWGWALNAARRCVELGPLPNPAIIEVATIITDDDE